MSLFGVDVARLLERLKELLFPLAYAVFNSPVGFLLLQFSLGSVPHTNVQRLPASSGSTSNEPSASSGSNVEIIIVPCAADNYGYLLVETGTKEAIAVDPLDAERFVRILTDRSLVLTAILCTHKHWDHTGGNAKLHSLFPNVPVYGHPLDFPASNASWMMAMDLTRVNRPVHDNEILHIGSVSIQVLHTPCHTRGSVMYLLLPSQGSCSKSLFTGDTLFTGGVGMFFEGDGRQMHRVLQRLAMDLDPDTEIYPGHEYTLPNLTFCSEMEPDNEGIMTRLEEVRALRKEKLPTIPSSLLQEQMTNVFMRVSCSPSLANNIQCKIEADYESDVHDMMLLEEGASKEEAEHFVLLGYLRRLKDKWKAKRP